MIEFHQSSNLEVHLFSLGSVLKKVLIMEHIKLDKRLVYPVYF